MSDHARAAAALFDPDRLKLAREAAGLTKAALAEAVGVTATAIGQFENQQHRPSAATVAKLAWTLDVSPGYFASRARPVPLPTSEEAFFRSMRATTRRQRRQASARAAMLAEISLILEDEVELPDLTLPPAAGLDENAMDDVVVKTAERVREHLGLADRPAGHLVRLLETQGVLVIRLPSEDGRVSAFSQWFGRRPVIVLQNTDIARLRFDLAHELGHLVMHDEPDAGNALLERQANLFAANFLMPAHQLGSALPARFDLQALLALKQVWGVSIAALLYRSRELGCMTDAAYRNAAIKMSATYGRKNEPRALADTERPVLLWRAAQMIYGADPADALAQATHLPAARVLALLNVAPAKPKVTPDLLLGDLDARRKARGDRH